MREVLRCDRSVETRRLLVCACWVWMIASVHQVAVGTPECCGNAAVQWDVGVLRSIGHHQGLGLAREGLLLNCHALKSLSQQVGTLLHAIDLAVPVASELMVVVAVAVRVALIRLGEVVATLALVLGHG